MTHDSWPFPTSKPDQVVYTHDPRTVPQMVAEDYGVRFVHLHLPGRPGGCTVAYAPTVFTKNCKMLEIAVAYTHPRDNYSKKVGIQLATDRWLSGNTVVMPLRGKNVHETTNNLWNTFYYSVYSY